jgi:anti-sigma regulatory factor (Ser/Thr protein kinase)
VTALAARRSFPADRDVLRDVRRFVAAEVGRLDFPDFVPDLQLAVTEACANAILHSGTDEMRVSVESTGPCLQITVEDDGVYKQSLPLPELDGEGHRGLQLMVALVDDVSVRRGTEEQAGTTVRLRKCRV